MLMTDDRLDFTSFWRRPAFWIVLGAFALLLLTADPAHASQGGGAGLPWEGPLEKLKQSISGPVAFVIALLGIVSTGAMLIWGGEISEFTRRMIYVVLVVCIIVFANSLLTGALINGALIPNHEVIGASEALERLG